MYIVHWVYLGPYIQSFIDLQPRHRRGRESALMFSSQSPPLSTHVTRALLLATPSAGSTTRVPAWKTCAALFHSHDSSWTCFPPLTYKDQNFLWHSNCVVYAICVKTHLDKIILKSFRYTIFHITTDLKNNLIKAVSVIIAYCHWLFGRVVGVLFLFFFVLNCLRKCVFTGVCLKIWCNKNLHISGLLFLYTVKKKRPNILFNAWSHS